jgi:acyl dehydratase
MPEPQYRLMPDPRNQLTWADVADNDELPRVVLDITRRRLFVNAAASWDTYPGHHDVDYARAHGHRDVFANTSLLLAFADRVIIDWAGPRTRILRRSLAMSHPVYPGDRLCAVGRVRARRCDGDLHMVEVDVELSVNGAPCARAQAIIELPNASATHRDALPSPTR